MARRQGIYWLLTIPHHGFHPYLPPGVCWIRGQLSAVRAGIFTGRSAWGSTRRVLFPQSPASLARSCMPRSPEAQRPPSMCGRKTPGSPTPSSSSESVYQAERSPRLGSHLGRWPLPVTLEPSAQIRVQSYRTLRAIGADFAKPVGMVELAKFTGVELGLGSHGELGKRQAWTLMLKIQTRSFGVGTVARELLSSMNFEEESMCLTSSDGLTVIQSTWKSKAVPVLWQPQRSG